jgi:(+)-trans-carveol dehydrogenase
MSFHAVRSGRHIEPRKEIELMGLVDGKVALVTGAGRGQGRSHALKLAAEGADVIAVDIGGGQVETISYELASEADLDTTVSAVEAMGRRAVKAIGDVRSLSDLQAAVDAGLSELGKIDIVCANAGIGSWAVAWEMTEQQWKDMIDINLTGVFNATRAALPSMVERGEGGSVVLTSSTAGLRAYANTAHYTAAKHGVIGLMKVLAQEAGPHRIRVNAVCPTTVRTPLVINDSTFELFAPHLENPTEDDVREPFESLNILPGVAWIEPEDVSDAVVFLCSDAAKFITGVALPIDAGNIVK